MSHDGDAGDKLDVADVLLILQHIVKLRDDNLILVDLPPYLAPTPRAF